MLDAGRLLVSDTRRDKPHSPPGKRRKSQRRWRSFNVLGLDICMHLCHLWCFPHDMMPSIVMSRHFQKQQSLQIWKLSPRSPQTERRVFDSILIVTYSISRYSSSGMKSVLHSSYGRRSLVKLSKEVSFDSVLKMNCEPRLLTRTFLRWLFGSIFPILSLPFLTFLDVSTWAASTSL